MRKKEEKKLPYCKPMAYLMTMPGYMPLMAGSIQADITGTIDAVSYTHLTLPTSDLV